MAENKPELQRGLEARHIELIALGGTIGVGLFMGLQQIEGNLIYPHVVGGSVGLPSIWEIGRAHV